MKVFVTGAAGQLGHDVMNELYKRGHEGIGSDLKPEYAGVQDGSPVTRMPYVSLDITDEEAVHRVIRELAHTVGQLQSCTVLGVGPLGFHAQIPALEGVTLPRGNLNIFLR